MEDEKEVEVKYVAQSAAGLFFGAVGNGLGCLLSLLGLVALIWAFSGFPGLL